MYLNLLWKTILLRGVFPVMGRMILLKTRISIFMLLALIALSSNAWAYRLISIPSGDLLATGYTRIEYSSAYVSDTAATDGWYNSYRLDTVPLENLEIGVCASEPPHKAASTSVNVQYQVFTLKGNRPNLTVGAWDVASNTSGATKGRAAYTALAFNLPPEGLPGPIKVTVGYGDQKLNGLWGGVMIPLNKKTQAVAEYCPKSARLPGADWYDLSIGHNITPNWRVKVADLGGYAGVGLVYINHLK
jgi:hypothetical protein